jgi:hypothetical protein
VANERDVKILKQGVEAWKAWRHVSQEPDLSSADLSGADRGWWNAWRRNLTLRPDPEQRQPEQRQPEQCRPEQRRPEPRQPARR